MELSTPSAAPELLVAGGVVHVPRCCAGDTGCCCCCRRLSACGCALCQLAAGGAAGDGSGSWKLLGGAAGGATGAGWNAPGTPGMLLPSFLLRNRVVGRLLARDVDLGSCKGGSATATAGTCCWPTGGGTGCCTTCRIGGCSRTAAGSAPYPFDAGGTGGGAPLLPGALPGLRISAYGRGYDGTTFMPRIHMLIQVY